MNEAAETGDVGKDDVDFQDHVEKRADAGRGQGDPAGSGLIDRDKFAHQLRGISDERQGRVLATAEDIVRKSGQSDEQAVLAALREETTRRAPRTEEEITSPDVSLEHPHGPEGATHGGRDGRDPLQYVEDSTPAGANAYSRTHGPPQKRRAPER